MSLELERLDLEQGLRDSLHHQAMTPMPVRTDPWAQFTMLERRHRRSRWTRRGAVVLAAAAAITAVAGGVVPLPRLVSAAPIDPAGTGDLLQQSPTRGSLAHDKNWLAGLRRQVAATEGGEAPWRLVPQDPVKVLFAGDVPSARAALVTVTLRSGADQRQDTQWYQGSAGAGPQQMRQVSTGMDGAVETALSDVTVGTERYLLAVGPAGSTVRTSLDVVYGADGRLHRDWRQGATGSGLAIVAVPPTSGGNEIQILATLRGHTIFDSPVQTMALDNTPGQASTAAIGQALAGARGPVIKLAAAADWVGLAFSDSDVDPASTTLSIPWTGVVEGRQALLLQLTPRGGGSLFYALSGDAHSGEIDLRLLTPTDGAFTRPILWRLKVPDSDLPSTDVVVVTSAATTRADLVIAGSSHPIGLSRTGSALVHVPVGAKASVRAYHDGILIGETPLIPPETDDSGIPGDRPDTRLVN